MKSEHTHGRASLPSDFCRLHGGHTINTDTELILVSLKTLASEIRHFLFCEFANLAKGSDFIISSEKSSSPKKGKTEKKVKISCKLLAADEK